LRMNSAPRSAAEKLAELYRSTVKDDDAQYPVGKARQCLNAMGAVDWNASRPADAVLTGEGYRNLWRVLSGEGG